MEKHRSRVSLYFRLCGQPRIITSLCNRDTEIFSDRLNHASIIDGVQLSGGRLNRYLHCNMADLEKKLKASGKKDKSSLPTHYSAWMATARRLRTFAKWPGNIAAW